MVCGEISEDCYGVGIGSLEELEVRGGFWWVEGGCREVWDEAMVTMAVLFKL